MKSIRRSIAPLVILCALAAPARSFAADVPCDLMYADAVSILKQSQLGRGDETKVRTKLENAWRAYALGGKNGREQALRDLDLAVKLLDTFKPVPAETLTPIRSSIEALAGCLRTAPAIATGTVDVRVLSSKADGTLVSAGAGATVSVQGIVLGTTNASGTVSAALPAGTYVLEAVSRNNAPGRANVTVVAGTTQPVDVVVDPARRVVEKIAVESAQIVNGVLPRDFRSFTLALKRGDETIKIRALGRLDFRSKGTRQGIADMFTVQSSGELALREIEALRAILVDRFDPFVIEVIGIDAKDAEYQGQIEFSFGRHRASVRVTGLPAGMTVPVRLTHQTTGLNFWSQTGANGVAEFGWLPSGGYVMDAEAVIEGERRLARGSFALENELVAEMALVSPAKAVAESQAREGAKPPIRGQTCYFDEDGNCHPEWPKYKIASLSFDIKADGTFGPRQYTVYDAWRRPPASDDEQTLLEGRGKEGLVELRALDAGGNVVYRQRVGVVLYKSMIPGPNGYPRLPLEEMNLHFTFPHGIATVITLRGWLSASEQTFDLDVLARDPVIAVRVPDPAEQRQ